MLLFRCESSVTDEKDINPLGASREPPDCRTVRFPTLNFETYLFREAQTARQSYGHQEKPCALLTLFAPDRYKSGILKQNAKKIA